MLENSSDHPSSAVHPGTWVWNTTSEISQLSDPMTNNAACR